MADDTTVTPFGGGNNNGGGGNKGGPKTAASILAEIKGEAKGVAAKAFKEKLKGMVANRDKIAMTLAAAEKEIADAVSEYDATVAD